MIKGFNEAIKLLSGFSWDAEVTRASVMVFVKANGRQACKTASTMKDDILNWKKRDWEDFLLKPVALLDYVMEIEQVLSVVISFRHGGWECYRVECTDVSRFSGFNRIILPTVELLFCYEDQAIFCQMPYKEFYLRPEEMSLINSTETVVIASKLIDPNRLKTTKTTLPYALKDKEDFRLIPWPEYFS